ncbi:MAG: ribonuclease D [Alphaproteobacteria bacterium]
MTQTFTLSGTKIYLHQNDLPADVDFGNAVAVDTETMGLKFGRDRLCLVQLSSGNGEAHIVQLEKDRYDAPNLKKLFEDKDVTKIFHFARFDVVTLAHHLGVMCTSIYCTKIASKLARTYTDRHGLKDLCREILGVELSKQQQSSNWGAETLTEQQLAYAASDVLYLHQLREKLDHMLATEERSFLAASCFDFLPTRGLLDLEGWGDTDIFAHS